MFGTPFAYVTQRLALLAVIPGGAPAAKIAIAAAIIAFALYLINLVLSFVLPELKHEDLSD